MYARGGPTPALGLRGAPRWPWGKGEQVSAGGGGRWLVSARPSGGGGMSGGAGARGLAVLGLFPGLRGGPTTGRL